MKKRRCIDYRNFFDNKCEKKSTEVMRKMFYKGISTERGTYVEVKDALLFAIWRVLSNEEEKKEFVEWFFSGNWIEVVNYE